MTKEAATSGGPPSRIHVSQVLKGATVDWIVISCRTTIKRMSSSPIYQCVFRPADEHLEPCCIASCAHEGLIDLYYASNAGCDVFAVLVLAVPTNCVPAQLARMGGIDVASITGWRRLTHHNSGQQSVIVEFSEPDYARQLCAVANGKLFNESNSSEICYALALEYIVGLECCIISESKFTSFLSPSPDQQVPSCPRCLERLDISVSGLPPPNCLHRSEACSSPHSCTCVSNWSNMHCKLCSSIQMSSGEFQCQTCSALDNLWVCLLCCHIGCNRFHKSHAIEHFHVTGHRFSLELTSAISLWDYKGDGYIHRVLADDSKHNQSSSSPRRQAVFKKPAGDSDASLTDAKLESLLMYYNQMLISQLQRTWQKKVRSRERY